MSWVRIDRSDVPRSSFRQRATEGVATWLSRLPGGVGAYLSDGAPSAIDAQGDSDRLRAFVLDRVTTNPVTRQPLAPVQIHLLELVLEAVDWPSLPGAAGLPAEDGPAACDAPARAGPAGQRSRAGGPSPPYSESFQGGAP